jgi:hypothetical protein
MLTDIRSRRLHKDAQNQPVKTCLLESSPSQAATAAQSRSRAQSAHRSVASKDSASTPALGLQELRVCFDGKCLTVQNAPELGLNNGGDHCQWSNIKCTGSKGLRCLKICEQLACRRLGAEVKLILQISI